jgi:hypothetical protein
MFKSRRENTGVGIIIFLVVFGIMFFFLGTGESESFSTSNNIARSLLNQENPSSETRTQAMRQQQQSSDLYDDYNINQLKERMDYFIDKSSLDKKSVAKENVAKIYTAENPDKKINLLGMVKILRLMDSYYKIKNDILPRVNLQLNYCNTSTPSNFIIAQVNQISSKLSSLLQCILAKEIVKPQPNTDILVAIFLMNINIVCISKNISFRSVLAETSKNKWLLKGDLKNETQTAATDVSMNVNFDSPMDLKVLGKVMMEYFKKRPPSANCELCKITELED